MNDASAPIRISKEEATSQHVDDLLKRQMGMRGEPGVARDRRRKWYYQNWLVLMLTGALGAFTAWALIEPVFDDELYIQGPVANVDPNASLSGVEGNERAQRVIASIEGSFEINEQKIFLITRTRELLPNGDTRPLDATRIIKPGNVVGVYVEYHPGVRGDLSLATFVEQKPKPLSPERASMTLSRLHARSSAAGLLIFPLVAGLIGLFVGVVDGIICRQVRRAVLSGVIGLMVGFIGGFLFGIFGNLAYNPLNQLATAQMAKGGAVFGGFGFLVQTIGRSLAWCLCGIAMGLGQGIALRSPRLILYGLFGGLIGGLLGGLLFDPIDMLLLGTDKPSAHVSRLVGIVVIGASVGAMIGIVELLARDAWLRMTQGPLTGKEFLLFKDTMAIGASPRSDIYLFNDTAVSKNHAVIRMMGDECEIEAREAITPVLVNNRAITRVRLRHGDNITIGRTSFTFHRRKS